MSSLIHLDEWPVDVSSSWLLHDNLINRLHFSCCFLTVWSWFQTVHTQLDVLRSRLNFWPSLKSSLALISDGLASVSDSQALNADRLQRFFRTFFERHLIFALKILSKSDTMCQKQLLIKLEQTWLHVEIGSNSNVLTEALARLWPLTLQTSRPSIRHSLQS